MVVVKQVMSKSILGRSNIPNIDYAINPYIGCEHKCVYCYARFMKRFTGHPEAWGEFVDVKVNAAQILDQELPRKTKGLTYLSSVTDPYQPLEKKHELTMNCLRELLAHRFPITIQTKSSLVLRDIDLLAEFPECAVGFTITSIDDEATRKYEPCSSPVEERLAALEELHDRDITTFAFLGPILPHITDDNQSLHTLTHNLARVKVTHILVDRLNLRCGVWPSVISFLNQYYPELIQEYKRIFWSRNDYFEKVKLRIIKLCDQHGVRSGFSF